MNTPNDNVSVLPEVREWLWPVALAVTVFLVSGRSQVAAPDVANVDKLAHFAVYGLLGTLVARVSRVGRLRWFGVYWAIAICSLYGLADEFHQSFTPGRSVEFADWLMDTSGAAVAVFLYARWGWYRRMLESGLVQCSSVETSGFAELDSVP